MTKPDFTDIFGQHADEEVQTMMREDLDGLDADELRTQLHEARDTLADFMDMRHVNRVAFTALNDARERTEEALRRLEA